MFSKRKNTATQLRALTDASSAIALTVVSFLAACVPTNDIENPSGTRGGSKLSSVQMSVPSTDSLVASDGKKPINGLRVIIKPVDESACANGSSIDEVVSTAGVPSIQKKIVKGCDYDLRVELGKFASDAGGFGLTTLGEVYYAPASATRISAAQTKDDRIAVRVNLALTDEGRRIGLPENLPTPVPEPQPAPQPAPQPDPQPAPQPQPSPQPAPGPSNPELPAKLNVSLTGKSGSVSLPSIFTTPYLVLEFSRPGCPPCVALAKKLESDANYQRMMGGSKCRSATIIPTGQLSDWISIVGGQHTSASSYEYSHSKFATLFGASISATPTVMIVDRSGKVVDQNVGGLPSKLQSMCGGI